MNVSYSEIEGKTGVSCIMRISNTLLKDNGNINDYTRRE